jgi:GTPase SAR1 family protein
MQSDNKLVKMKELKEKFKKVYLKAVELKKDLIKGNLEEFKKYLNDQMCLDREFQIMCIGGTGTGKSSLLNAWLGLNLLPTKPNGCTFAITEIRYCESIERYRITIDFFKNKDFNRNVETDIVKDTSPLVLENIMLEEVPNQIKKKLADKNNIKKIEIKIPKCSPTKQNFVLIDIPGNLPISELETMINQSDVIILTGVFNLGKFEEDLLKIIENSKEKTIVTLTMCDFVDEKDDFKNFAEKNRKNLKEFHNIINLSSIAEFCVDENIKGEQMNNLKKIEKETGFKELKEKVDKIIYSSYQELNKIFPNICQQSGEFCNIFKKELASNNDEQKLDDLINQVKSYSQYRTILI